MEKILQELFNGQKQLFDGQKQLLAEVKRINTRLESVEGKLDENIQVAKGLVSWTEEINAQVQGTGHALAKVEGKVNQLDEKVDKLDKRLEAVEEQQDIMRADLSFLVRKAAEHDDAMRRLKKVK
ncbi:MAG: hypothetical protein E6X17_06530 [Sporomusaceae bacterium]|nr:hypothetical protein [Sporomusaceae bacterium]